MSNLISWIALALAVLTGTGLLLSRDWRWSLGFLAALYLGVFWLVQAHWSVSMAAAKLVTGWMACAVMGLAQRNAASEPEQRAALPQGRLFQLLLATIVLAATFAAAQGLSTWLGISLPVAWGSLLLVGLGLLHLGITSEPFPVIIGLLTVLAGFEILYASVENSILVAALLALVNLGLAMAGAYFITSAQEEEEEETA